jgi:hypothetical protein
MLKGAAGFLLQSGDFIHDALSKHFIEFSPFQTPVHEWLDMQRTAQENLDSLPAENGRFPVLRPL